MLIRKHIDTVSLNVLLSIIGPDFPIEQELIVFSVVGTFSKMVNNTFFFYITTSFFMKSLFTMRF